MAASERTSFGSNELHLRPPVPRSVFHLPPGLHRRLRPPIPRSLHPRLPSSTNPQVFTPRSFTLLLRSACPPVWPPGPPVRLSGRPVRQSACLAARSASVRLLSASPPVWPPGPPPSSSAGGRPVRVRLSGRPVRLSASPPVWPLHPRQKPVRLRPVRLSGRPVRVGQRKANARHRPLVFFR